MHFWVMTERDVIWGVRIGRSCIRILMVDRAGRGKRRRPQGQKRNFMAEIGLTY